MLITCLRKNLAKWRKLGKKRVQFSLNQAKLHFSFRKTNFLIKIYFPSAQESSNVVALSPAFHFVSKWSPYLLLIVSNFKFWSTKRNWKIENIRVFCPRHSGRPITRKGENTGPSIACCVYRQIFTEICSHAAGVEKREPAAGENLNHA